MIHLLEMAKLIEASGVARQGQDLFLFTIPAEVQNAVMLRGPLMGDPIDEEQPGFFASEFLVVLRDGDEGRAFANCMTISAALTIYRQQLGSIYALRVVPRSRPIAYPRSEAGTIEWGIPFKIEWGEAP